MKRLLILCLLLVSAASFAGSAFPAIPFSTEAECLTFQVDLLSRIPHQPQWLPFVPQLLIDGRWVAQIADSVLPNLADEERARIVQIDRSLIPPDPWPPIGGQP